MGGAHQLLAGERSRKQALRDSFVRQINSISGQRHQVEQDISDLKADIAKLRLPSKMLEDQLKTLQVRVQKLSAEETKMKNDVASLDLEVQTLSSQLAQLSSTT